MIDLPITYISGNSTGKTVAYVVSNHEFTKRGFVGENPKFSYISSGQQASEFEKIYREIMNGILPAGSIETCDYYANFCIDDNPIVNINFKDYRGKMLVEDENAESYLEFQRMLQISKVLIMIIPGNLISDYIEMVHSSTMDINKKREIESIITEQMMIIRRTLYIVGDDENGRKKTIIFYITKSDMIPYNDRKKMDSLIALLKEYNLIHSNRKFLFCHSTLGRNLDLGDDGRNQVRTVKTIQPEGFEMPSLLAVGHTLSQKGIEWEEIEYEKLEKQKMSFKKNRDRLQQEKGEEKGKIFFKIRNMFSSTDLLSHYDEKIELEEKKMKQLEQEQLKLSEKNTLKQYGQSILAYIESKNIDEEQLYVVYVNENGQERPLKEFFG